MPVWKTKDKLMPVCFDLQTPETIGEIEKKKIFEIPLDKVSIHAYYPRMASKFYSRDEVIGLLRTRLGKRPQVQLAEELGISKAHLSDILRKRRFPGPEVLKKLGLKSEAVFVQEKAS